jgi:hypothetical protein
MSEPYEDDLSRGYMESASMRSELNSPALRLLREFGEEEGKPAVPKEGQAEKAPPAPPDREGFVSPLDWARQKEAEGIDRKALLAQLGGLKDPGIANPVEIGAAIFGGAIKTGLAHGVKLLPNVYRALASASIGTATEYPLGMATEKVEQKFPRLSLPFSVVAGMVSGMTIESMAEKAVINAGKKLGAKLAPEAVQELKAGVMARLKSESGQLGGGGASDVEKEAASELVKELNGKVKDLPGPAFRHLTGDPERPLVEISREKADDILKKTDDFLRQDTIGLPEKAININFARIESGDDVKDVIARTAEIFGTEIQGARRGVQANEETARLAGLIGMTPEKLLARRRGQAFNAEEALAARRVLVSSGERLSRLARIINGRLPIGETEFADATLPEIQAAFQKQLLVHTAIQEQVSGMTAEAGRALQSFRIVAASTEGKLKQIDELMRGVNRGKMSTEDLAAMVAGIESGEGLNVFVRQARKATSWDMVMEGWINGLLSGPVTHVSNMTSNALVAALQIPERAVAAGIGRLSGHQEIRLAEAGAQAYGLVEGFKDGLRAFGKTMATGEGSDLFTKVDTPIRRAISAKNFGIEDPGPMARAIDLLGGAVRTPGRMLSAEDEFFKSIGYRMELRARAYRQGLSENLQGDALNARMQEILNDPPDDIRLAAIDAARYQTFTKELGETGRAGLNFLNKAPALRLIVPFVQTPMNILKFAGERTPLAFASKRIRQEIAAGGARRDMALARISMGSMVMATSASLASAGMVTGGGPTDPELRQALYRRGWQPYSLKIGDKYYSYNRLEPLGMLFGLAADASEIMGQADEHSAQELAVAAVVAISKNVTSKTWLKGVSDAVAAMDDPERSAKHFLQNYARSLVPAGAAQLERALDPTVRETYSEQGFFYETWNTIKSRVPGWSDELPPKRNLWGEAIVGDGALGPDILSPVYMSTAKKSPIDEEMLRLKMKVGMPAKEQSFEGEAVDLTAKEYDLFIRTMNRIELASTGMTLKKSLDALTRDPEYKAAPDERKEIMIRRRILEARETAKGMMLEESQELRGQVDNLHMHRERRQESSVDSGEKMASRASALPFM